MTGLASHHRPNPHHVSRHKPLTARTDCWEEGRLAEFGEETEALELVFHRVLESRQNGR